MRIVVVCEECNVKAFACGAPCVVYILIVSLFGAVGKKKYQTIGFFAERTHNRIFVVVKMYRFMWYW